LNTVVDSLLFDLIDKRKGSPAKFKGYICKSENVIADSPQRERRMPSRKAKRVKSTYNYFY